MKTLSLLVVTAAAGSALMSAPALAATSASGGPSPVRAASPIHVGQHGQYGYLDSYRNDGTDDYSLPQVSASLNTFASGAGVAHSTVSVAANSSSCEPLADDAGSLCTTLSRYIDASVRPDQITFAGNTRGATFDAPAVAYTEQTTTWNTSTYEYTDSSSTGVTSVHIVMTPTGDATHYATHGTICGSGDNTCQSIRVSRSTAALGTVGAFGQTWGTGTFRVGELGQYNGVDAGNTGPLP